MAITFSEKGARSVPLVSERETQSMVFFNTPEMELLYSGEAKRKPSCSKNIFFNLAGRYPQSMCDFKSV